MESDSEFLDGLIGRPITVSDRVRLFALARKGAAVQMAEDVQFARIRQLEDEAEQYRRERDHAREISIRYETELARKGAEAEWRPIETAPKDGTRMLLAYRNVLGKWRRVIAFYAPKLTIEQSAESEWLEYDEALDRYCLPEGWYECIDNWDDYTHVHISEVEPTHWQPLPPPPQQENENE